MSAPSVLAFACLLAVSVAPVGFGTAASATPAAAVSAQDLGMANATDALDAGTAKANVDANGSVVHDVSGLQPGRTYEYRVVVATSNDTVNGSVREFSTPDDGSTTASPTQTPVPCPSFRGAGALCTTTPTPTSPGFEDDGRTPGHLVEEAPPNGGGDADPTDWLAGLAPLFGWVAAVGVVGPVVLGGLLVVARRCGDAR